MSNSTATKPNTAAQQTAALRAYDSGVTKGRLVEPANLTRLLPFAIVFVAACMVFFFDLGKYPLFNPDEALYAEPAREMLETGQYITTLLNYIVRFTKPPLVIWVMAGNMHLFGATEFAARFFGAACGAILVGVTYLFAENYVNRRAGLIAAFALITAPLYIGNSREAITDMPLSLFTAGSLMAFYHGFQQHEGRWSWLAYTLIGMAIMTKGPVGLLLPVVILLAFHILRGDLKQAYSYYKPVPGLALTALIAVPWFAVEISITKGAYFNEFILRENFQRFTGVVDHKEPWWYHIAAMFGGFFPWSLFLPQAVFNAFSQGDKERKFLLTGIFTRYRNLAQQESVLLFSALTGMIILVFFSLSVSKLLSYTVPAFPAIAVLVGAYIDRCCRETQSRALQIFFAGLAIVYGAAALIFPHFGQKIHDCPADLLTLIPVAVGTLGLIAAVAWLATLRGRAALAVASFAVMNFLAILTFGPQVLSILSREWEEPIPVLSHFVATSDWPIIVVGMRMPSVPFYTHRQVLLPRTTAELQKRLRPIKHAYILTRTRNAENIKALGGSREVSTMTRYVLFAWTKQEQK